MKSLPSIASDVIASLIPARKLTIENSQRKITIISALESVASPAWLLAMTSQLAQQARIKKPAIMIHVAIASR
jgi:hypothetical protein